MQNFYSYRDPSVRLTGRWDTRSDSCARTTNPGAYFEIAWKGSILELVFDLEANEHPYPHVLVQTDGGAIQETSLDRRLRVFAPEGEHICRVVYKSSTEALSRWRLPIHNALSLCGYAAAECGTLAPDNRTTIEFVGDSITEGVLVDIDYAKAPTCDIDEHNRAFQDDATATYAWLTAEMLDMRPYICGFGAVGLTRPGKGRVPAAPISYPFNYEGSPITHSCDVIVLNHGANDRIHTEDEYIAKYGEMLKILRKHNPNAIIFSLSAFCGAFHERLGKFIAEYNAENGESIHFIDSTGWVHVEPLHPLRPGHRTIAEHLAEEIKKVIS